jgi:steroid 5-alpha reductase family enzyme
VSGFATVPFLTELVAAAATVAATMAIAFTLAIRFRRHSVVDTFWGLGFVAIAGVAFGFSPGGQGVVLHLVILLLTAIWGLRLAIHVGRRSRGKGEDPRYRLLLARSKTSRDLYALRVIYLPQGIAMFFISLPVQVAMFEHAQLGVLGYLGMGVFVIGFGFESIGDYQLTRFLADPASKDEVLDRGLWAYTRHPNYFGDACLWWGLYLLACATWPGALTILSPAAMSLTLARGTGKPVLEKGMAERRPGYAHYVATTSGFIPLPRSRSNKVTPAEQRPN